MALALFVEQGFEATTMDDVARGVGIARRTLFTYYPGKSAIVWEGRKEAADAIRDALRAVPEQLPWREALVQTLPRTLRYPGDDTALLRQRLRVIGGTPSLHAHLLVEQESAADVVAAFVAERRGTADVDAVAHSVARAVLAAVSTSLVRWAGSEDPDPREVMTRSLATLLGLERGER